MIIAVSLLLFSSTFISAEEIVVKEDTNQYLYYNNGNKNTYLLHFSMDKLTKSVFTKTNDNYLFKTDSNVVVDKSDSNLAKVVITKNNDTSVLVNGRFTYVFNQTIAATDEANSFGKFVNDGYLLPSILGKPKTGFFGFSDFPNAIIKKSDKDDSIVTKDGKKVFVCANDWMLKSNYNGFLESDPVEVEGGAEFFNGNDYKLDTRKRISFGNGIKVEEGGVVKAGNKYIATYFGLPLYVSRKGSDNNEIKTEDFRTYYSINYDGTVNINNEKVVPFTADFEKKFVTIISTMIKLGSTLMVILALLLF